MRIGFSYVSGGTVFVPASGAKCGKQVTIWHAVHHYKARLLLSIHSILRLRRPEELTDPHAAATRLKDVSSVSSLESIRGTAFGVVGDFQVR